MDNSIQSSDNLECEDKDVRYEAYVHIMTVTKKQVDWTYEVWDQLKEDLTHPDNHRRSRAAQFLSSLAISDPEKRILKDFPALWEVTKDPMFVTARHCLQSVWKIGLAGPEQKEMVVNQLINRFNNCKNEKNSTLIRSDIIQGLKNLYDEVKNEEIQQKALDLIETEEESKYRKKLAAIWRTK